jgi:hypothetical protein
MGFEVYGRPRGKFNCFSEYGVIGRDSFSGIPRVVPDVAGTPSIPQETIPAGHKGYDKPDSGGGHTKPPAWHDWLALQLFLHIT